MPTYQYACTDCGERTEVVQKFTDEPLSVCEACGGKLRKVYSAVGIVFKGSGFYRNDSRTPAGSAASANGNGKDGKDGAATKEKAGADSSSSSDKSSSDKSSSDKSSSGKSDGSGGSGGSGSSGSKSGADRKAAGSSSSSSAGSKVA